MRRLFADRALHSLFALWFVLSAGEPSLLRTCPMHFSASAEVASEQDMAGKTMPHHGGGHGSRSSDAPGHEHSCNCVECAVDCASAALHPTRVDIGALACSVTTPDVLRVADDMRHTSAPHLQPPGTGPPRVPA
jgi:hypothetical protein